MSNKVLQADPIDLAIRLDRYELSLAELHDAALELKGDIYRINAEYGIIVIDRARKVIFWEHAPERAERYKRDVTIVTDEEAADVLG